MPERTIIYFEDDSYYQGLVIDFLGPEFPDYKLDVRKGERQSAGEIFRSVGGVEKIAAVCTDGALVGTFKGWELIQDLRKSGYNGPTFYVGSEPLPKKYRHLFTSIVEKNMAWRNLIIPALKKYLKN